MKFDEIDKIDDLPEVLKNYLPKYIANRIQDISLIEEALSAKDSQAISNVCHRINGTAANYGLFRLEAMSRALQVAAKKDGFDLAEKIFWAMKEYLNSLK